MPGKVSDSNPGMVITVYYCGQDYSHPGREAVGHMTYSAPLAPLPRRGQTPEGRKFSAFGSFSKSYSDVLKMLRELSEYTSQEETNRTYIFLT